MQSFPKTHELTLPTKLSGHLWVQELATGGCLRFRVASAGHLVFGTREQTETTARELPPPYRRAARFVRERFDRNAFQAAADDPREITFFGIATWYDGVAYDWERLPPFLGVDVWAANRGRYLPPGAATTVFDRLKMPSLPAIEKERPEAHTDLAQYTDPDTFPTSEWGPGPAAGILVRDKSGARYQSWGPTRLDTDQLPESTTVEKIADRYVPEERITEAINRLQSTGHSPTVASVRDQVIETLAREHYAELYRDGESLTSMETLGSFLAERIQRDFAEELE